MKNPNLILHARRILNGEETRKIHVNGTIIKQPTSYNPPWNYHLDPESIGFFELSAEVCDSSISYIEENLADVGGSVLPANAWCPWSSRLVEEVEFSEEKRTTPVIESVNKFTTGGSITACNFTSDGTCAITGNINGMLSIWDLATGKLLREKKVHAGKITGVLPLNQTDSVVTCGEDGKMYKWNIGALNLEVKFAGHNFPIQGVRCPEDEKTLFSYAGDLIKVWDMANGQFQKDIHFGTHCFDVREDGAVAVSTMSGNPIVHIWILDAALGRAITWSSRYNGIPVTTVDIRAKGSIVAYNGSGNQNGKAGITVWDYHTNEFKEFNANGEIVSDLCFSPKNSGYLLGASNDSAIRIWDVRTKKSLAFLQVGAPVTFSKFSQDGNHILSYTEDGALTYSKVTEVTLTHTASIKSKMTAVTSQIQKQALSSSIKGHVKQTLLKPPSPRRESKQTDESQKREREKDVLQPAEEGKKRATTGRK